MSVLVISFDAVSDKVFESMAHDSKNYPNIAKFKQGAFYRGGIKTVFMTNTYPVHTSVSTGRLPKDHGIISNLLPPDKKGERRWVQKASLIKTKTIWDAAKEKKLSTAAIVWPVTCGAKIDYHIPEVHAGKGQNILFLSLMYGSFFFQIAALLKHGKKLLKALAAVMPNKVRDSCGLPSLDNFTSAVTSDLLKRKKPALTLVHLVAYDITCHYAGLKGKEIELAMKEMDTSLGKILENSAADTIIVFSDHAQLDIIENINLRTIYKDAVFEQCGGSAFFVEKDFAESFANAPEKQIWFGRYLSEKEIEESGYADKQVFGIAAKPGYCFSEGRKYKGNHGYPADYENYNVFYCVKGKNFEQEYEQKLLKNSITDVTAIIAKELGLEITCEST